MQDLTPCGTHVDIINNKLVVSKIKPVIVYSLKKKDGVWKLTGYKSCPIISKETAINFVSKSIDKTNDVELKKQNEMLLNDLNNLK